MTSVSGNSPYERIDVRNTESDAHRRHWAGEETSTPPRFSPSAYTDVALASDQSFSAFALDQLAERVAERVVELLRGETITSSDDLVDAQTLADRLGVARSFVYRNADRLGAVRLSDGPKAALRFDVEQAKQAMSCSSSKRSQAEQPNETRRSPRSRTRSRRRLPNRLPEPGSVLQIRPREAA